MATGTAPTVTTTQPQQQYTQYSNATVSNITISNGTGVMSSNLHYYTTNFACGVYTNYMKKKSFKLR